MGAVYGFLRLVHTMDTVDTGMPLTYCVLSCFGKSLCEAQKRYLQYIEAGIEEGRRPGLVGGGLIRSLGGWQAVKDARFSGQDRIKGDHRILGDSVFVMDVSGCSKMYAKR